MSEALQWFGRTHDVEVIAMAGAVWRLARFPREGAIGAQDAKLMSALDFCRQVANGLLAKNRAPSSEQELKSFHEQQVSEKGR